MNLLFPGSDWAERISTVFSLKHPVYWGYAYCTRTIVCSVTTALLWGQLPLVWTVVKVSLAQSEGEEREAKKAMGHLCTAQSPETRNSPRTVWEAWQTDTNMCCAMMALLHLSSQHFFSLFSLYWPHSCKSLHQMLWTGDTITAIPTSQLPETVWYRLCCQTWAVLKAGLSPIHACGILQTSVAIIQKAHKGSTRNSAESDLFQSVNTTTWATLVTI